MSITLTFHEYPYIHNFPYMLTAVHSENIMLTHDEFHNLVELVLDLVKRPRVHIKYVDQQFMFKDKVDAMRVKLAWVE